jgi:hypothetical protein
VYHGETPEVNGGRSPAELEVKGICAMRWLLAGVGVLLSCFAAAQCACADDSADAAAVAMDFAWSGVESQPQKAAYIQAQLRAWRKTDESQPGKSLRVVYFHPQDREPLKDHAARWDAILTDIEQFYRDQMQRLGYGEVTLSLEREDGRLKLHEVRGAANDDGAYNYRAGGRIRTEVAEALAKKDIDANKETLLIVCGLSKTEDKQVTIYSPYYGMGADHTRGICFTADMDWLNIDGLKPDATGTTLQVKEHRGYEPFTLARFNTTYIGGTIHELGHGLSLPHNHATKEEAQLGTALMGSGNYTYRQEWRKEGKGSFLTHAHAIRLLVHPIFSGTTRQVNAAPNLQLKDVKLSFEAGEIQVRGQLSADVPAIAMLAYNDGENKGQTSYAVNNDYDATTWVSVISPQNEFFLKVGDLKDGNHQLRLVSVHANGATVTHRLHYRIKDGVPDFATAKQEIARIVGK